MSAGPPERSVTVMVPLARIVSAGFMLIRGADSPPAQSSVMMAAVGSEGREIAGASCEIAAQDGNAGNPIAKRRSQAPTICSASNVDDVRGRQPWSIGRII